MIFRYISLLLYLLVSFLFIAKYGLRFVSWSNVIAMMTIYAAFVVSVVHFVLPRTNRWSNFRLIVIMVVVLSVLIVIQSLIDPYSLQVDRWSAIYNFLDRLFDGNYPYAAQTHLGGYGSPFPVWHFFHIPFYLLGNVGLSFLVGVTFFIWTIQRVLGTSISAKVFLLLVIHPAFLYEVAVRSDLLTNFLLSCALVLFLFQWINVGNHRIMLSSCLLVSVMAGLMMSTRLSSVIPFMIFFLSFFCQLPLRRQLLMVFCGLAVFLVTFLPFLIWDGEMLLFFEFNPFVLQTRQGHLSDVLLLLVIFSMLAFWSDNLLKRKLFASEISLLMLVTVTFVHNMWIDNSWGKLFESQYDITYFGMFLPFALIIISEEGNLFNNSL